VGFFDAILGLFRKKDAAAWAADARERLSKSKPAKALASAEKAVAMAPGDPDHLLLRAEILRALKMPEKAVVDVLAALDREPGRAGALLPVLEALEPSAPSPEKVWLQTWKVHAEKGELDRVADRVQKIAGRGDGALETFRTQCRGMLSGGGDRKGALLGLAILAKQKGDGKEAVSRILEAVDAGGKAYRAFAEKFLQELLDKGRDAPGGLRALTAIRVALGKNDPARDAVVDLCRRNPDAGLALLVELRGDDKATAAFALSLMASLEQAGKVPTALSMRLAEGLLQEKRSADAAGVVLRAVKSEPSAAEAILPLAVRAMKEDRGLDALEAHARAAALAGDAASSLLTLGEFVEDDPARALAVLDLLPPDVRGRDEGALLSARALAGSGEHERAAADLRRWSLGDGGARATEALSHVRAAAEAHPEVAEYALLLHDVLQFTGDVAAAGKVLLELVTRDPTRAEDVERCAASLLKEHPEAFDAGLAAARAGLVRSAGPDAVIVRLRTALEASPGREADVLALLEGARPWADGQEAVELFQSDMVLRTGRVEEGLAILEDVVVRNPARGGDAQGILAAFLAGPAAGDSRVLFAEHRVRRVLGDHEGCVAPLRRVADLDEGRREEVLAALDAVVAEAPQGRAAHRAGVELAIKIGRPAEQVLARLEALLDVPTPPRDTEFVTRRVGALQAKGATVAGHRVLARCHIFAARWPLALEEVRRMVEADSTTRGEAIGFLGHVLTCSTSYPEARLLLASIHSSLAAVDAAREALAGAAPRTDEVFAAYRRLVEAYPTHVGARLDLVDALTAERRGDEALEECGQVLKIPGGAGPELVRRIDRILELSPEYAPALYALADVHHAGGDWAEEIAAYRRITRIAPREGETVLQRLDAILEREPETFEAALEIVRLVPLHQRTERAAPEGRRAVLSAKTPAETAAIADALKKLERDLGKDPAFGEVLATALTRAGRVGPAVAAWRALLDRAPDRAAAAATELARLAEAPGDEGIEALRTLAVARLLAGAPEPACEAIDRFLERRAKAVEDAREQFRRVLAAHPASHEAAVGVARTSVLAGDVEGAVEARLHDLRQHPDRRRETGKELAELRAQFPEAAAVPLAEAEFVHLPLDLLDDAALAVEAGLALDPVRHAKALALAETVLGRDAKSKFGTRVRARALAAAGRLDEAVAAFRALAELDPRMREDALAGFDGVLAAGPGHGEAQYRRAEVLLELGRAKEATAQAEALLGSLRPSEPRELPALFLLANAKEGLGDFAGALEALRRAAKNHPAAPAVLPRIRANRVARLATRLASLPEGSELERGEATLEAGDARGALTEVGPEPQQPEALAGWRTIRGRAFFVLGEAANALAELEEAVKGKTEEGRSPAARDALYYCGLAYLRTGEMLKAVRRLEQVARVAPKHRRVREALDRVYDEDRRRLERPLLFTQDLETLEKAANRA
jgi:tetratricopeptide (TPR) repeat protein